jgi:hypothetical protein
VLEEAVILETDAPNAAKDVAFHEVVGIGAKLCTHMSDLHSAKGRYILHQ